jgi:flagellar protein FliO/FliZ
MNAFALNVLTTLLALGFVLALAWGSLRLLRGRLPGQRSGADGSDESLQFVRALPVGARERVVLVEHRGERWMLGVTAGGISVLARWPRDAKAPAAGLPVGPASPPWSVIEDEAR